jgi:HEAT repeat protein
MEVHAMSRWILGCFLALAVGAQAPPVCAQDAGANIADLLARLQSQQPLVRRQAAQALLGFGPSLRSMVEVPVLLRTLRDPDAPTRQAIVRCLGLVGPTSEDVVPALAGTLSDQDAGVRASAADALGAFGGAARDALPSLETALSQEQDPEAVRAYARAILAIDAAGP